MKILLIALALFATLRSAAWSDIPPPQPTTVTVANMMAFPGFKFTYAVDPEYGPKKFTPLRGEQVFRNQFGFIHLFVEDGDGERFEWATVKLDFRGKTEVISILDVRRDGKTIKVNYKEKPDPATRPKSAGNGASPAVPFMLSALSLGAVVLLIRRQRTPSAGG